MISWPPLCRFSTAGRQRRKTRLFRPHPTKCFRKRPVRCRHCSVSILYRSLSNPRCPTPRCLSGWKTHLSSTRRYCSVNRDGRYMPPRCWSRTARNHCRCHNTAVPVVRLSRWSSIHRPPSGCSRCQAGYGCRSMPSLRSSSLLSCLW